MNNDIIEGYSNDGEEGSGEKLLFLVNRMEVVNILVIVLVWDIAKNNLGVEFNRLIVNKSRELLNTLHEKVIEAEHLKLVVSNQKIK